MLTTTVCVEFEGYADAHLAGAIYHTIFEFGFEHAKDAQRAELERFVALELSTALRSKLNATSLFASLGATDLASLATLLYHYALGVLGQFDEEPHGRCAAALRAVRVGAQIPQDDFSQNADSPLIAVEFRPGVVIQNTDDLLQALRALGI